MIVAPQIMAGARPLTQLVAPSKHLPSWHPLPSYSHSNNPAKINMLSHKKPLAFHGLSLSAPHNKLKYNKKSRFLASALASSYYDDESHNTEEGIAASSALQKEQKIAVEIPSYVKLVLGVALKGQILCFLYKASIFAHVFFFTGLITSPAIFCATAGGLVSAYVSLYFDFSMCRRLHWVEVKQLIANDPSKDSLRTDIMKHIKYTIPLNLFGLGATLLGMKKGFGLETGHFYSQFSNVDYHLFEACRRGLPKASEGALICHLLGLASSLVLLRWITKPLSTSADGPLSPGWFWSWPA